MIEGILLIDKKKDITSYDVIRDLKRVLPKGQKIGHAGTLDPFATGLLIILLGKGTKLMDSIHSLPKEYLCTARLGLDTDTYDLTGEVVYTSDIKPSKEDIQNVLNEKLIGDISQLPPRYSAKKINGRKAYDMARNGEEFELKPKDIHIYSIEILRYEYPYLELKIKCSTGTYIRSIIHDLGIYLNCFATTWELRRTCIGEYDVRNSVNEYDDIGKNVIKLEDIDI